MASGSWKTVPKAKMMRVVKNKYSLTVICGSTVSLPKPRKKCMAQGKTIADVCRAIEVTQPTYHRWKQQYGGMQAEEAKRLTQLEKENARL